MNFDTVLVANRGEIACRIIASACRMGLRTVAVFSEADRHAPHVRHADTAVYVGEGPARESYLRGDRILDAAAATGAGAIHPGYGFLSENADFAASVEAAGMCFVGPTPDQLRLFGQKHTAREAAAAAGVTLLPGSALLTDLDAAIAAAEEVGWPVMVKATAGGGGIGMQSCESAADLARALEAVERVAAASFGSGGVFLEALVRHARHVEVQLFGDGKGLVITLGDRDCTLQRRHQKVIEEAPAPDLPDAVRSALWHGAAALGSSVAYRSAGTVEYIYDDDRQAAFFLEVNTRLQVEHGVTEAIFGVDLVEWMFRLALGEDDFLHEAPRSAGSAIEARVYAEDPGANFQPSSGLITEVTLPEDARVDTWIERGTEVSSLYDPLLAKVIVHADTRDDARRHLDAALESTRIDGIATNLGLLRAALDDDDFATSRHTTATLEPLRDPRPRIEVVTPGSSTTVQDWPGRLGYWAVGVPPSGPMDDLSFRLGNAALANPLGAPGLEAVLAGPTLRFSAATTICVTGAPVDVTIDGERRPMWRPLTVPAGATVEIGGIDGPGLRSYVLFRGGLDVPRHLGSASTFTLGAFGGHGGRALRAGDVLRPAAALPVQIPGGAGGPPPSALGDAGPAIALDPGAVGPGGAIAPVPEFVHEWTIGVLEGPHAAPEFFTPLDIATFYATAWEVHFQSARTGVRLVGPQPRWARADGGEAGLHPSNIHDTPYAVATVDFTGDTPILLGPDGPSLGGFVCPATVAVAERWKLGQLRPGDTVRFVPISTAAAAELRASTTGAIAGRRAPRANLVECTDDDGGVLGRRPADDRGPEVTYRRQGDDHLLIEYGPMTLDLGLRLRVQSLADRIAIEAHSGIVDLTPGIRSLQLHVDPDRLSVSSALRLAQRVEDELPPTRELAVDSRIVDLPLSWDDPAVREATSRYMGGVREDAPWCPWNIEFIRRINGLDDVEEVRDIVHAAEYLVLGLGDVYLGAPVATPLDPRHRLVTTKYNPARTWTPQNAVGIGGAYLCIYGMEGPGGYQLVGRTVPIWSRWHTRPPFEPGVPWLLRYFDRIRWYPVEPDELLELRADMAAGRLDVHIEPGTFVLADYERSLVADATAIAAFRDRQQRAFAEERERWRASGEFDRVATLERRVTEAPRADRALAAGEQLVLAPVASSVWRIDAVPGEEVGEGDPLFTLEAMKLEVGVVAPAAGTVVDVLVRTGEPVPAGQPLLVLRSR